MAGAFEIESDGVRLEIVEPSVGELAVDKNPGVVSGNKVGGIGDSNCGEWDVA